MSEVDSPRFLLLAAGKANRWRDRVSLPKYLDPIDGEPLTKVVQEGLVRRGAKDVRLLVAQGASVPTGLSAVAIEPFPDKAPSDKFLSSRAYWNPNGQTVLVFADVYFSDAAMNELFVEAPNSVRFVGRMGPSSYTGCAHKEIFALSFGPELHGFLEDQLRALPQSASRPTGWLLYRHLQPLCGQDGQPGLVFSHVDDMTEDFDCAKDHETWVARREKARSQPIFKRNRRVEKLYVLAGMIVGAAVTAILWSAAVFLS